MNPKIIIWIAFGGAIGSVARQLVNVGAGRVFGAGFPWHTLIVNVAGCFAMGLVIEFAARRLDIGQDVRVFLTTGILGGFTTFSAFSLDFALLVERKAYALAGLYAVGSVILSLAAVFAGLALVRALFP